ncbi:dienelactone hydrolase family protein [Paracoccus methylovorus]|uniref:Dienelactone hydrolase family protein n=1 Tax=Paracoccus methylovorus TaxID=2812658 RepID=A0ABX7JII8_9RHOB|nr:MULTISPECIES: dienelactone hydrolase family protein [Paracoccus]QRZ13529.1 dienelactone hydrolase family protein [Paracoccus methylovorus]
MRKSLTVALTVLGVLVLALVLNTARNYAGWQPDTDTPAERRARLEPHWRLISPDGPGPHPAAVLLSGCDGVYDNMDYWAQEFVAMGRAALILDSHAPRNLDKAQAWRAICAGQVLPGTERAGDLAVALTALRGMPGVDASDVALLGASHGGWTVMELLRQLGESEPPPGLTAWPAPPESLAAQLGPVVLLYPYCGLLNTADKGPWPDNIQGLMLLAEEDSIIDSEACRQMATEMAEHGAQLAVKTYPGINHGFDQREHSLLSPLEFDPKALEQATRDIRSFMQGFAAPPPGI